MHKGKNSLLFLAAGGMELSWIYAISATFYVVLESMVFPLMEATAAFFLAALLTLFYRGRRWWVLQAVGLHLLGFTIVALRNLYVFYSSTDPFFNSSWVVELFSRPKEPIEGLILGLVIFWSAVFWAGGLFFALRPLSYFFINTRFDLGIGVFFFILLVSGGIEAVNPFGPFLLFSFFLFSMTAIVMARNRGRGHKEFLAGYRGMGLVLFFSVTVLIFTGSIILFFLPYLTMTAEAGYSVIKGIASPLAPLLLAFFRFFFGRGIKTDAGGSDLPGDVPVESMEPSAAAWGSEFFQNMITWLGGGLLVLCAAAFFAWAIWKLLGWLFSRTQGENKSRSFKEDFLLWLRLWQLRMHSILSFMRRIFFRSDRQSEVIALYSRLLSWGSVSGFPPVLSETPSEYGMRLGVHFPTLKNEIKLIAGNFNREVYGKMIPDKERLFLLRRAWRRVNSPLQWPSRFLKWFSHS
ncbi:MAG: DUF4129 domain-containing protein [Bacillota bacterium]|nr:DUF4129 domain-containing protein [Bacillota bacterium]